MDMRKNINAAQAGDADPFWWKEKSKQKDVLNDSVPKTFHNMLVFQISNVGFMVNKHSKTITNPEFGFQHHILLQWVIL